MENKFVMLINNGELEVPIYRFGENSIIKSPDDPSVIISLFAQAILDDVNSSFMQSFLPYLNGKIIESISIFTLNENEDKELITKTEVYKEILSATTTYDEQMKKYVGEITFII